MDFGLKWYNEPCSQMYWNEVLPVFCYLEQESKKGTLWNEIQDKELKVYRPLLQSFITEVERAYALNDSLPEKLVSYILGRFDFYKIISFENKKVVNVIPFNLRGELNQRDSSTIEHRKRILEISKLPTEIVLLRFKSNSNTTVELYMNNGWQFNFRIHNAEKVVRPTLKFDVQIVGMPSTILVIQKQITD